MPVMLRHLCAGAAALLAVTALPLAAQEPFARARLEPGARVTVGQPVTVVVEVLVPTWFTAAPWFPSLEVDDAIAVFDDRGVNFTERIDGETWSGQSRSYDVYPQRPGVFTIDAVPVRVRYTSDAGPRTRATVSPPAGALRGRRTTGRPRSAPTSSAPRASSSSRASTVRPETLKVGEAVIRTVTVSVADAPVDGPAAAPRRDRRRSRRLPRSAAGARRGGRARRADRRPAHRTHDLGAEKAGRYRLDEIEVVWWDVDAEELRRSTLPAVEVEVIPNPDLARDPPAAGRGSRKSVEPARGAPHGDRRCPLEPRPRRRGADRDRCWPAWVGAGRRACAAVKTRKPPPSPAFAALPAPAIRGPPGARGRPGSPRPPWAGRRHGARLRRRGR